MTVAAAIGGTMMTAARDVSILAAATAEACASATRQVLIAANPTSGGFRLHRIDALASALRARGIGVDVHLTRHAGHLTEIARTLPRMTDTLVVAGGDGSINEAIYGLTERAEPAPALAVLPCGTANVLAHELGLPFQPAAMAEMLVARRLAPLHLGRLGRRPFALMISAGFDGAVVHAVDPVAKWRWGKLAYLAAALRLALARNGRDVVVDADGKRIVCRLAVVTTARCYGGPMSVTRNTHVTEPGLRLITLCDDRPLTLLKAAAALGCSRLDRIKAIDDRSVMSVRFGGERPAMQMDGDRIDASPDTIEAHPTVLSIIVCAEHRRLAA